MLYSTSIAYQTSVETVGVMEVTATKSGTNYIYSLADVSQRKWYLSFICNKYLWQLSNDPNYTSSAYIIQFTNASATIGQYRLACLVLNTADRTITFKDSRNLAEKDFVLQTYLAGVNTTPWYNGAFTNPNMTMSPTDSTLSISGGAADAVTTGDYLRYPGNFAVFGGDVQNAIDVSTAVSGTDITYTMSDVSNSSWYELVLSSGISYHLTNDSSYTASKKVLFAPENITAKLYEFVAISINKTELTITLKKAQTLLPDDLVLAVFRYGLNVTPIPTPIIVNKRLVDKTLTQTNVINGLFRVFKKVGCAGDSWTAGYIRDTDSGVVYGKNNDYAWPSYMEETNNQWINGGFSGASTRTYLTDYRPAIGDGFRALQDAGVCQAYTMAFGINDSNPNPELNVPVGDVSDIGTSADTFYAHYAEIINALLNISPNAFVFCLTIYPQTSTLASRYRNYNDAIRSIVDWFQNQGNIRIRLLDLANRSDLFTTYPLTVDLSDNHYGCIGWGTLAGCIKIALDDELADHPDVYHDINRVPLS